MRLSLPTGAHRLRNSEGAILSWSFQIDGRRTARDEFLGGEVLSTGATLIDASPGLRFVTSSGSSLYAYVQVPLHQHVNEAQLAPRTALLIGVRKAF